MKNFSLNHKSFFNFMKYGWNIEKYHSEQKKNELEKQKLNEEYENSLKELEKLKEEQKKIIEEKEKKKKKLNEPLDLLEESIKLKKLEIELEELKNIHKKEELELKNKKDIDILKLEYEGNINTLQKGNLLKLVAEQKSNHIKLIELKYECLKDDIYNDKEFDELIEIAKKKKEEILNDELDNIKEQRIDVENFEKNSKKKLENLKEKNDLEIQKKQFELKNYKLTEYNKLLADKKKLFEEFKKKFSGNQLSNENLKNKEIEKAKMYFEQQKNNLKIREQIFNQQKQNIHAFIKQLEINDDDYSKGLLNLLK